MRATCVRTLLLGGSMLALPLLPATAVAQQLQEIIVTAQKRVERLQETPVAVSAVTEEMLEQRGIVDTSNLGAIAPNVTVGTSPSSSNTLAIFIRGIGAGEPILTADAPVGVYVDGIVLGRSTGAIFDLVDLQRVEVLRGPQGTLYGRNTTGGAVNLITAKPSDTFGLEQKFSYGSFNAWSARTRLDTGEIGDSGFRAKLAYVHKQRNGTVDNVLTRSEIDPGSDKTDAVRVAFRFDQGGAIRADYGFDYSRQRSNAPAFQLTAMRPDVLAFFSQSAAFGGAPFLAPEPNRRRGSIILDNDGPIYTTILGHNLTLEADIGDTMTLRSMTGYRVWNDVNRGTDLDGNGALRGFTVSPAILVPPNLFIPEGSTSVRAFHALNDRHQHQVSEELNLLGSLFEERFEYVLGGYYFRERAKEYNPQSFSLVLGSGAFGVNLPTSVLNYQHISSSKAVFGQGTVHITDELGVTGGVRYTSDRRHLIQASPIPRDVRRKFSKVNWAASIDYKWTPEVMTFARVATGYKAGGINARASNEGFDPENLTSYEIGLKSELFDRRLRFNAGVYIQRLKDLQIDQFAAGAGGATSITINAGKVNAKGFEAELNAVVFDGFTVNGTIGYNKRKYKEYLYRDPVTNVVSNIASLIRPESGSAKLTYNLGAQYDVPKFDYGQLSFRLDWTYRSKVYYHPSTVTSPLNDTIFAKGYGLLDARVTLSEIPLNGFEGQIAAYVKNLADKEYKLWGIDFGGLGFSGNTWGTPRTFGIEIGAKF